MIYCHFTGLCYFVLFFDSVKSLSHFVLVSNFSSSSDAMEYHNRKKRGQSKKVLHFLRYQLESVFILSSNQTFCTRMWVPSFLIISAKRLNEPILKCVSSKYTIDLYFREHGNIVSTFIHWILNRH